MGLRSSSKAIGSIFDIKRKLNLSSASYLAIPFLLYIIYTGIEVNISFKFNLFNRQTKAGSHAKDTATFSEVKTSVHSAAFVPTAQNDASLSGSSLFCAHLIQDPVANYKQCYRSHDNFTCMEGPQKDKPVFFGSVGQDHYLWTEHFSALQRRGVYLDVATNHPFMVSNTFFFDRCLGWRGLCVEANHKYFAKINAYRTCDLIETCMGAEDGETVTFVEDVQFGGVVSESYKHHNRLQEGKRDRLMKTMTCTTVATETRKANIDVVDFMSVDVEGHELQVLKGIDWEKLKIKVILVEVENESKDEIRDFLTQKGFSHHVPYSHKEIRKADENPFVSEEIWLGADVVFGNPV